MITGYGAALVLALTAALCLGGTAPTAYHQSQPGGGRDLAIRHQARLLVEFPTQDTETKDGPCRGKAAFLGQEQSQKNGTWRMKLRKGKRYVWKGGTGLPNCMGGVTFLCGKQHFSPPPLSAPQPDRECCMGQGVLEQDRSASKPLRGVAETNHKMLLPYQDRVTFSGAQR